VQNVTGSDHNYAEQLAVVQHSLVRHFASTADISSGGAYQIYQSLQQQASVLSDIDVIESLAIFCACMVPLVFLMKRQPKGSKGAVH
jgi:DHA2 family multidrug resistance protein